MKVVIVRNASIVFLSILLLSIVALNLFWLKNHQDPIMVGHDAALVAAKQLSDMGDYPLSQAIDLLNYNSLPPFYSLYNSTAWITTQLFGRNHTGMVLNSTLYFLIFIVSVFGTALHLGNRLSAVVAAFVAACLPMALTTSRIVTAHNAIIALPALGIYLLVLSDWYFRSLPLMLAAVLAALSMHFSETDAGAVQMLIPYAVVGAYLLYVRLFVLRDRSFKLALKIAAALTIFLLLVNWNLVSSNFSYLLDETVNLGQRVYRQGNIFENPKALFAYPAMLVDIYVYPFFSILCLLGMAWLMIRRDRNSLLPVVYLLGSLLLVALEPKKQTNYLFFILASIPLVIGLAVGRIPQRVLRIIAAIVVLIGGGITAYQFTCNTERPKPVAAVQWYRKLVFSPTLHPFVPKVKHSALREVAQQIVELANNRENTSLLCLHRIAGRRVVPAFLYHLTLADTKNKVTVLDSFKNMDKLAPLLMYEPLDPDFPDLLLYFSLQPEQIDPTDPSYLNAGFFEEIMLTLDQFRLGDYRKIAANCAEKTAMLDFHRFRVRQIYLPKVSMFQSWNLFIYDRPQVDLKLDPLPQAELVAP